MAAEHDPDCITMDILMPGMDGRETIARLKSDPQLRSIPIVVISVVGEREHLGVDAALDKPVDESRLLDTVRGLVRHDTGTTRPCLIVRTNGVHTELPLLVFCGGQVRYCSREGLWKELEAGFQGTVIVPDTLSRELDLEALAGNPGIQVIVVPEIDKTGQTGDEPDSESANGTDTDASGA